MKKFFALLLIVVMCLSLVACDKDKVVRLKRLTYDDGTVITHGYNKNDVHISEVVKMPDGSFYEHKYDKDGNHMSEISTLADGSYHEVQYDKNGNVVKEVNNKYCTTEIAPEIK